MFSPKIYDGANYHRGLDACMGTEAWRRYVEEGRRQKSTQNFTATVSMNFQKKKREEAYGRGWGTTIVKGSTGRMILILKTSCSRSSNPYGVGGVLWTQLTDGRGLMCRQLYRSLGSFTRLIDRSMDTDDGVSRCFTVHGSWLRRLVACTRLAIHTISHHSTTPLQYPDWN